MASYENFYKGSYSTLEPEFGDYIGYTYKFGAGRIGAPTSPQTADQIKQVTSRLSEGMRTVEMQVLSPETLEAIPKDHLKEINRLAKLTGSEMTMHAPVIDPAGFTKEGWSETNRDEAERRLLEAVERGHEMNPEGNIPVTIHASTLPAAEFTQEGQESVAAVDPESGKLVTFKREERFEPEEGKVVAYSPKEELEHFNDMQWREQIRLLEERKAEIDALFMESRKISQKLEEKEKKGEELSQADLTEGSAAIAGIKRARALSAHLNAALRGIYPKAYEYDEEARAELEKAAAGYRADLEEIEKIREPLQAGFMLNIANEKLIEGLRYASPKFYKPVEEFAIDKASKTLGNVAFEAYKQFGETAPVISVENVFPNMAFSRAEQLRNLIEESRKQFVENAVNEGMSRGEAKREAEKHIGATWDTGHINLLRKEGFGEEKIIEETKTIAPYIKHVHLTDNFGYADTHLPPGMGKVPVKGIMEELEKAGYSGKFIAEAGGFAKEFKISPHPYVLEALGSPLYHPIMAPYWSKSGYGAVFPEHYVSIYGTGFAGVPAELGGMMPGKKSRFAGTPAE